jgi:glycosyltransferase involved in cell wall biosynthesis
MKITFVCPPPSLSGGLRVVATHAERLRARGHDVLVVAPRRRPVDWKRRLKALMRGRRPAVPPPATHLHRMQAELKLLDHPGPVTDADLPDADAVIATWWETAFAVAALSPAKGRKFYFIQHHEVHPHLPSHISAGSYHLPLRKIVISNWLRDVMADVYGDADVALVRNSVDTELFHAGPRGRQAAPTVGLMYSTKEFKGVRVALEAIGKARRRHSSLQVVAFGVQPVSPDLPLPPGSRFFRRPAQEELRRIYASCDVFLTASRSEGFGLPVLEAMACRCPVVATRTGCAPDVIEDGVNGFLADIDDVDGLAEGLGRVLDRPEADWRRMSEAAFAEVANYSWDDAAAAMEAALRDRA